MSKKIKLDPNKVEYDGNGFRIVVKDEDEFWNRLKDMQEKIRSDLDETQREKKAVMKRKLRPLGDILLELEPLYLELMLNHKLQYSDFYGIVNQYNKTHGLDETCLEQYTDGTIPVFYYGHKDGLKEK